jgi:hypothetical protein
MSKLSILAFNISWFGLKTAAWTPFLRFWTDLIVEYTQAHPAKHL